MAKSKKAEEKNTEETTDGIYRITIEKDMTGAILSDIENRLIVEKTRAGVRPVVLDLTQVKQIDSRGLALCIGLFKECAATGEKFSIEMGVELYKVFKILKLTKIMDIREVAAL
jgi:anti-anti-sigma factor